MKLDNVRSEGSYQTHVPVFDVAAFIAEEVSGMDLEIRTALLFHVMSPTWCSKFCHLCSPFALSIEEKKCTCIHQGFVKEVIKLSGEYCNGVRLMDQAHSHSSPFRI